MTLGKAFRVYHRVNVDADHPYYLILEQRNKNEALLFQSGMIRMLNTQETDNYKKNCSRLPDAYGCLGILPLYQGEAPVLYLVLVSSCLSIGKVLSSEIFRVTETNFISLRNNPSDIERIQEVKKVLNSGTFYFSWSSVDKPLDLTLCEQRASYTNESDNRFFWNSAMHIGFIREGINCEDWLLKVICGGIEIRTIYVGHLQARGCIFSRLSSERAGTRFNVRGTNDEGCVANFVETEQVIYLDSKVCSYVQIRGSVPLFWEQPGLQVGSHKVKLSRGSEASAPAFDRHLTQIIDRYGEQVLINLLGSKESEAMLSQMFQNHHRVSRHSKRIPYVAFDYHAQCRGGHQENLSNLRRKISSQLDSFGFFYKDGDRIQKCQNGTFRTNCLDCLDRTNSVQTFIGLEILKQQLAALGISEQPQITSRFTEVYKQMWTQNGDQVSKMYAGTGALEGRSKLRDGSRSVVRTIQNNLLDSSKQEAIDILLLGSALYNEIAEHARSILPPSMLTFPTNFLEALCRRKKEFTYDSKIRLGVATWNVNGGKHFNSIVFKHQSMTEWLLDCPKLSKDNALLDIHDGDNTIDIFVIGFEEIVDLNASNIVSASSQNQKEWMAELQKTISRNNKYIYITSTQLVGVCLFLFALPKHAPYIRDVATDVVKTGLGGAAGNKGGVAIRMTLYNTSMFFVCAHLTAGQSQISERNADYHEITKKFSFPMGRTLDSHEYVFWCGDFNYRIDLPHDEVKKQVKEKNFDVLLKADQLKSQQQAGQAFKNFIEAPICFPPTYKYDIFSDDYDTSEKCRIPSWTDRVLFRRKTLINEEMESPGNIVFYGRAELKTSDHRPVIAYIDVDVPRINEPKRLEVFQEMISAGPPDGTVIVEFESTYGKDGIVMDTEYKFKLLQELFKDNVIQIRFIENECLLSFKEGKDALKALEYNDKEINDCILKIRLKTPDWCANICKALKLCQNNTVPLVSHNPSSIAGDSPFRELAPSEDNQVVHTVVAELHKEVLKCLDSKDEYLSVFEGYDSDYDSKSQTSSGRCSPYFDGHDELKASPVKVPPRPPPPSRSAVPQRPPPPQRPPNPTVISKAMDPAPVMSDKSEKNNNTSDAIANVIKDAEQDTVQLKQYENYVSCPPPSAPPPPPPQFDPVTSASGETKSTEKVPKASAGVNPPPIPMRPKQKPAPGQPPPLPARSLVTQNSAAPPIVPRKSAQ